MKKATEVWTVNVTGSQILQRSQDVPNSKFTLLSIQVQEQTAAWEVGKQMASTRKNENVKRCTTRRVRSAVMCAFTRAHCIGFLNKLLKTCRTSKATWIFLNESAGKEPGFPFTAEIGLDLICVFSALTGWSLAELPIQNKIAFSCDWALTSNNNCNNNNKFYISLISFNTHFSFLYSVHLAHHCSLVRVPK